jgi:hypothetical protein
MLSPSPRNAGGAMLALPRFPGVLGRFGRSRRDRHSRSGVRHGEHEVTDSTVPVWCVSVCHYWYETTQHWMSTAYVYEQAADDVRLIQEHRMDWGPFDTERDVKEWAELALERALGAPGVPWGSRDR